MNRLLPGGWWVLALFTGTLYLWYLGAAFTCTGHEAIAMQGAREMLATGDWLVPRLGGKPWLEKPALAHWCIAIAFWLAGGASEFAARLPSAVAGVLAVLLVAWLAARWFGPRRGLLAGLIQATTVYTLTYARLAEADIYLFLIVLACIAVFARAFVEPAAPAKGPAGPLLFFLLLGMTQLAKGPLFGAAMVLLPCIGYLALRRWPAVPGAAPGPSGLRWMLHPVGLGLGLAVALAWPLAILAQHPESAHIWWVHTIGRLGQEKCLNPEPVWYYLTTLPWQLLPWSLVVLLALPPSLRRAWREPQSADRFLWLWFLLPFAALTLARAKHHHYVVYALPACSIWAADGLLRLRAGWRQVSVQPLRWMVVLGAGTLSLAAYVLTLTDLGVEMSVRDFGFCGVAIVAGGALIHRAYLRRHFTAAGAGLFALIWILCAYVHAAVLWKTDRYVEENAFLQRVNARQAGQPVLLFRADTARFWYYSRVPMEVFNQPAELAERGRRLPEAAVIASVLDEPTLRGLGPTVRLEQMLGPRIPGGDRSTQLALYRVQWAGRQ